MSSVTLHPVMKTKIILILVTCHLSLVTALHGQSSVKIIQRGTGLPDKVLTVTTAATGTNWTTLPSQGCTYVLIINDSGTDLQVRYAAATTNVAPVLANSGVGFNVANNSNELQVRRKDTSNTQVTITPIAAR